MTTNNTHVSAAGLGREVVLPASTAIAAANTNQFDVFYIPPAVRGLEVVVNVTAITSTPSITVSIQGIDGNSGATWTILTSAAITATGTTVLKVYPELPAVANLTAQDILPPRVRVQAVHANANSITYSMTAELIY